MSGLRLVLECRGDGVEAALLEGDRLVGYESTPSAHAVGERLFFGRVTRVDPHLGGAFVDIGRERPPAFLLARDAQRARKARGKAGSKPTTAPLSEGQRLLVQGQREAEGDKGPRVTAMTRLKGRFLVFRAGGSDVGASPRIKGRARELLLERCRPLLGEGGFTLRRLACDIEDALLQADAEMLRETWRGAQAALPARDRSGPLQPALEEREALVWQLLDYPIEVIEIADEGLLVRVRRMLETLPEEVRPEIIRLDGDGTAFVQSGAADEIGKACARELPLSGGGRLLIEHTAACIAIDVDGQGRTALDVDLEAAAEIGRQLRLRNLAGTIVIDFVDLPTKPQRQRLEEVLRRAVRNDPLPVQIYPMSPLGIVQISRARRGSTPLRSRIATCPTCGGTGKVAQVG